MYIFVNGKQRLVWAASFEDLSVALYLESCTTDGNLGEI